MVVHKIEDILEAQGAENSIRVAGKVLGHWWWCWWVPVGTSLAASCRAASELRRACSVCCLLQQLAVFHQAMQLLSHCQGTAILFFFCLPLFFILRVALGVAHAAAFVDVLPLSLPLSLLLSGQLGWWLVVLAASGVSLSTIDGFDQH